MLCGRRVGSSGYRLGSVGSGAAVGEARQGRRWVSAWPEGQRVEELVGRLLGSQGSVGAGLTEILVGNVRHLQEFIQIETVEPPELAGLMLDVI